MSTGNARVAGSNFSTFQWRGQDIAYLDGILDSGQKPVGDAAGGPVAIHPLGYDYPIEWAVPRAMNHGTLTLTITELWNKPVWQHLHGLASAQNLLDVWRVLAADPSEVTCQTIINPPGANYVRIKTYHNVVIMSVDDSEQFDIDSMIVSRQIMCGYTHAIKTIVSTATS